MSHKRRAEDELRKLKSQLQTMRSFLQSGDASFALTLLSKAEDHAKRASDHVHRIDET